MAIELARSDDRASPRRARILLVEPNRRYIGVLAHRLAEAGYRVITADSGRTAIAELHRGPVDLVLAELDMPKMDGAELAGLVRDEIGTRDIPVMLITGRSEPDGAVRAYEAGADDVILKPFHFEVLFARIERRLARVRAMQALRADNEVLDARVVTRAIELGELREQVEAIDAECRRLTRIVESTDGR
jgi:DNA-binding response OmpR family regulator